MKPVTGVFRCKRLLLLAVCALPVTLLADDGDAVMEKVIAQCPGTAKYILQGQPDMATFKKAEAERRALQGSAPETAPTDPRLREELLEMSRKDQSARLGDLNSPQVWARISEIDAANLLRLKQIIAQHGFPDPARVGGDGFSAAWLLVQHADRDPAFQQEMLELMTEKNLLQGEQLALLTDRVLRAQGKPQRYGSQFTEENGRQVPQPIEAPLDKLDERRASMGMMPFADYRCSIEVMYPVKKQKQ